MPGTFHGKLKTTVNVAEADCSDTDIVQSPHIRTATVATTILRTP